MHTIQLNIDDSIFEKFKEYPSISFEEAQQKVIKAMNNVSQKKSIPLDKAIEKVLHNF